MPALKKALIIDDDPGFRHVMAEVLRSQGWQVLEAEEGEAGLALARQHRPEVVLCDLLMPRLNGFQVCRTLRADASLRSTKIIVTSGRDYEADRIASREAGADEYLTKPIPLESLLNTLSRLSRWSGGVKTIGSRATAASSASTSACFKFWGVRGSIPTPGPGTVRYGGNTSCIEVRAGSEIIILDAGTGLRLLGRALMEEFGDGPLNLTLLLTHTHWDHIQGLPFFRPIYQPQCHMRILGYEGARKGLVSVLSAQMESPYFPVPFAELPGNIEIVELRDLHFNVGPVRVQAWFANHPGICVGYRLSTDEGSVAFFPDNEPYTRQHGPAAGTAGDARTATRHALGQEQKMIEFLRGADALVIDSQYDTEEYKSHIGWGHGCVDYTVALALKAGVKRLFLFHHDPDHNDAKLDSMVAYARKLVSRQKQPLQVDAAREGMVVNFGAARRSSRARKAAR